MVAAARRPVRIEMRAVVKRFQSTLALRGVDLSLRAGEIHGLLGENGAGKTTLMNVLSGLYRADAGLILRDGRPLDIRSPADALRYGIGMVHQHVELVAPFTALENILLGAEGTGWWLRPERRRADVSAIARRFGLPVPLDTAVGALAAGVQQKVEILKALVRGVEVLILDEPTTMLTPQEVDALFATIRALAEDGVAVVFITHKIREVLAQCDRVTVMRAGQVAATLERASLSEPSLVELMIGARAVDSTVRGASPTSVPVLELDRLVVSHSSQGGVPPACSLTVHTGEVVGVAGVAGNGQRELAEAIVGVRPTGQGRVRVRGHDVSRHPVRARLARGLVYVPEDRLGDGILPGLSVTDNLLLGLHPYAFAPRRGFDRARARAVAQQTIAQYEIQTRAPEARAVELSGGNIQKILVARALALARLSGGVALVAANPTRGLDVRAAAFVRRHLLEFVDSGGGVLLISEDLDELLQLSDRIVVMYRGGIVADVERAAAEPYRLGALMAGAG